MPVIVKRRGSSYCVIERDSGKSKKCYSSKPPAQKYASVLNMRHAGIPQKRGNR